MSRRIFTTALATLVSASALAAPVSEEKQWSETFEVGARAKLEIHNIWGDVEVRSGARDEIQLAVNAVRRANDQESFDRSLELIPLRLEQDGNTVVLRVGRDWNDWRGSRRCSGCELRLDIVVTVPPDATLDVNTINDGDVSISNVRGLVSATNVNGSVATHGVARCDVIETINGDVEVKFANSPEADCRVESLNGDITLDLPANSGVDLEVELGNGRIRSDVDLVPKAIPAKVEKTLREGRRHYDIEQLAGLRLGAGGNTLTVKSLNGDLIVARSQ